jgi:serine/threonine-protein kinase SIK2
VSFIHKHGILHRDIKLDNVLLDKSLNHVKICDFGVSKLVHKGEIITDQCGTPAYLAPEIVLDKGYEGFWSDIWSLGVLLYCMACGTVPFKANNLQDLHKAILVGKYDLPDFLSVNLKHLIRSMLVIVPNRRIPIDRILRHRWFDDCSQVFGETAEEETFRINNDTVLMMESFGYPRQHMVNSLEIKSLNHSYALYNLINLK